MNIEKLKTKIGNRSEVRGFGQRNVSITLIDVIVRATTVSLVVEGLPRPIEIFVVPDNWETNIALYSEANTDCGKVLFDKQDSHRKNDAIKFMLYDILDD